MSRKLSREWVTTAAAAGALGISRDHLCALRDEGFLKNGTHWRNISRPGAARPTYRWHIKRIELALETPPEKR